MAENIITVGQILKPQGIRGEVKVKVYLDDAEDFKGIKEVIIDGEEYAVLSARGKGEFAYISLRGVADRDAAELLRGKDLGAERELLPEPPEGRFYIADLTGCKVVSSSGEVIGTVSFVTPAKCDIYTLTTAKGEVSFPAADGVIESVDIGSKTIIVNKKRFKEVSV